MLEPVIGSAFNGPLGYTRDMREGRYVEHHAPVHAMRGLLVKDNTVVQSLVGDGAPGSVVGTSLVQVKAGWSLKGAAAKNWCLNSALVLQRVLERCDQCTGYLS